MESSQTRIIKQRVKWLEARYDAENDTIPGAPFVTYTNMELLEMVKRLVAVVEDLQDQINMLEGKAI